MELEKNSVSLLRGGNYIRQGVCVDDFSQLPRPYHSLAYVVQGSLLCENERESFRVLPGEVVFIPHKMRYKLTWNGTPETETYSCHFLFPPFSEFFAGRSFPLQKLTNLRGSEEAFAYLCKNMDNKEQAIGVLSCFYRLCQQIFPRLAYERTTQLSSWMEPVISYMERHGELRVEELARLSHMSVSRFFYYFRKEMGMSPIVYKNSLMVRKASLLLLSMPETSIEEISELAGFASASYFRRVFKEMTGLSPRAYRKTGKQTL